MVDVVIISCNLSPTQMDCTVWPAAQVLGCVCICVCGCSGTGLCVRVCMCVCMCVHVCVCPCSCILVSLMLLISTGCQFLLRPSCLEGNLQQRHDVPVDRVSLVHEACV